MSKGLLLIDGNNVAHAANNTQPLRAGELPTQAIYGFLRTMRPMVATYPMFTPVVLWDGASWRKMHYDKYKAKRTKPAATKTEIQLEQARSDFKIQSPYIRSALKMLGIRQVFAINYEADDLAGMFVQKSEGHERKILMMTADKDWVQLLRPNASWLDPIRGDLLTMKTMPDKLGWHPGKARITVGNKDRIEGFIGVPSPRAWLEIKAMMGDISDEIPGVGGIGPKGALELVLKYGSVASFLNQCTDGTIDVDKLPKKIRDFYLDTEKQGNFQRNMTLMDLNTTKRPEPINLTVSAGSFCKTSFGALCNDLLFKSMTSDLDGWCEPFQRVLQ